MSLENTKIAEVAKGLTVQSTQTSVIQQFPMGGNSAAQTTVSSTPLVAAVDPVTGLPKPKLSKKEKRERWKAANPNWKQIEEENRKKQQVLVQQKTGLGPPESPRKEANGIITQNFAGMLKDIRLRMSFTPDEERENLKVLVKRMDFLASKIGNNSEDKKCFFEMQELQALTFCVDRLTLGYGYSPREITEGIAV